MISLDPEQGLELGTSEFVAICAIMFRAIMLRCIFNPCLLCPGCETFSIKGLVYSRDLNSEHSNSKLI